MAQETSEDMKNWDVTFVRYVGVIIKAHTEEEARKIAEGMRDTNEKVGVIEETDEEVAEQ